MGSKKRKLVDRIKEGEEMGREAVEVGEQLEGDGSEIKSLLSGIDTSLDEDDLAAVRSAESGYSSDFKAEFREGVDTKAADMTAIETEIMDESRIEMDKVTDAVSAFREMAGVTDVGRRNAEGAADVMRESASEYQDYVDKANTVIDDTKGAVDSLRGAIDSIFG